MPGKNRIPPPPKEVRWRCPLCFRHYTRPEAERIPLCVACLTKDATKVELERFLGK